MSLTPISKIERKRGGGGGERGRGREEEEKKGRKIKRSELV
jgi:hypothetical protein